MILAPSSTPLHALRDRLPYPVWFCYRAIRTVLVVSAFAGFWGGAAIFSWLVLPVVAIASKDRQRACQRLVAASFRLFHAYMRALRLFDARPLPPLPPELDRPCVLVANHTTLVDVTAVLSQLPNVCCVAKNAFASSWVVGRLLAFCGFIPAGNTMAERLAAIATARRHLEQGFHVLVFPEGTRSPERSLLPFRRGAFEIACQANVPVVPLVLRCDPSALRLGQRFWQQPDTCAILTIDVDTPVLPSEFAHKSRRMRQAMEERYRSRLGLPPRTSPQGDVEHADEPSDEPRTETRTEG